MNQCLGVEERQSQLAPVVFHLLESDQRKSRRTHLILVNIAAVSTGWQQPSVDFFRFETNQDSVEMVSWTVQHWGTNNNDWNLETSATTTTIKSVLRNFTGDRPWSMTQCSVSPSNSLLVLTYKCRTRTKLYYCTELHTRIIKIWYLILLHLCSNSSKLVPKQLQHLTVAYAFARSVGMSKAFRK